MSLLRNFILNKKPHVIAVSAESREALMLVDDLRSIIQGLIDDEQFPPVNVELVDSGLAKVFANSTRGESEFREYPQLLREAISIARRLQVCFVYRLLCFSVVTFRCRCSCRIRWSSSRSCVTVTRKSCASSTILFKISYRKRSCWKLSTWSLLTAPMKLVLTSIAASIILIHRTSPSFCVVLVREKAKL